MGSRRGTLYYIPDWWRPKFREFLAQKGMTQVEIGKRFGKSQGWVSQIASGEIDRTDVFPELSRLAGIDLPFLVPLDDEEEQRLLEAWRQTRAENPEQASRFVDTLEAGVSKRGKK
jgi:transcriptional regulator with XRE-family HTH domain